MNYTLVGLFVLILGSALVGVLLWLTVGTEAKIYDRYTVYVSESVSGLNPKAAVKYLGVEVGRVATITLNPDNPEQVRLVLELERGTPVKTDTVALLATQGLTGLATVELSGGSRRAPALSEAPPGEDHPVIQAGPSLVTRLDNAVTNALTDFDGLMERLDTILGDDNQRALGETLGNLAVITGELAARRESLADTVDAIGRAADGVTRLSADIGPPLEQALKRLDVVLGQVGGAVETLDRTAQGFGEVGAELAAAARQGGGAVEQINRDGVPALTALLVELRVLTGQMQRLAEDLQRNPRSLLFGPATPEPGPGE